MTRLDRIQISYDLLFLTPFHCGTGLSSSALDRTVIRDAQNYLYVPGSTIKGAVRETCERLERSYQPDDLPDYESVASPHDTERALYDLGTRSTMTARIFGSRSNPGLLHFEDARQNEEQKRYYKSGDASDRYKRAQTDDYTQVRMNRLTRTAVPGALYSSEFGVKGLSFKGAIAGWLRCQPLEGAEEDGPTYSLLLLLAGLHLIESIGGNKSTGKGLCSCQITSVTLNSVAYARERWQPWFDDLDALSLYALVAETSEEEA